MQGSWSQISEACISRFHILSKLDTIVDIVFREVGSVFRQLTIWLLTCLLLVSSHQTNDQNNKSSQWQSPQKFQYDKFRALIKTWIKEVRQTFTEEKENSPDDLDPDLLPPDYTFPEFALADLEKADGDDVENTKEKNQEKTVETRSIERSSERRDHAERHAKHRDASGSNLANENRVSTFPSTRVDQLTTVSPGELSLQNSTADDLEAADYSYTRAYEVAPYRRRRQAVDTTAAGSGELETVSKSPDV